MLEETTPIDGRSARWAHHRTQRRAELLDVARHLIHDEGPDVTMEAIAAASGTSKSIVYRYFTDKAQLQRTLGLHILGDMHRRLQAELDSLERGGSASIEERIRVMVSTYVETAQTSPNVYRFVTRPSDGLNHFLSSVARMVAAFLPESTVGRSLWATGVIGFVQSSVDTWMRATRLAETDSSEAAADESADPSDPTVPLTISTTDPRDSDAVADLTADQLVEHIVNWLTKGIPA